MADPTSEAQAFRTYLAAVRRRIWLARLIRRAFPAAAAWLAGALFLYAIDRAVPGRLLRDAALPFLAVAGVLVAWAIRGSRTPLALAARYLDLRFDLSDASSAALCLPSAGPLAPEVAERARTVRLSHPARGSVALRPRGTAPFLALLALSVALPIAAAARLAEPPPAAQAGERLRAAVEGLAVGAHGADGAAGEAAAPPDAIGDLLRNARAAGAALEGGTAPAEVAARLRAMRDRAAWLLDRQRMAAFVAGSLGVEPPAADALPPEVRETLERLAGTPGDEALSSAARALLEGDAASADRAIVALGDAGGQGRGATLDALVSALDAALARMGAEGQGPPAWRSEPEPDGAPAEGVRPEPPPAARSLLPPPYEEESIPPRYRGVVERYFERPPVLESTGPGR